MPETTACKDPSAFVSWDGVHYIEATTSPRGGSAVLCGSTHTQCYSPLILKKILRNNVITGNVECRNMINYFLKDK
jgi:hypothetical protein